MKDRKNSITTNDENNLQADTLTDLAVTDQQAAATRGGDGTTRGGIVFVGGWGSSAYQY